MMHGSVEEDLSSTKKKHSSLKDITNSKLVKPPFFFVLSRASLHSENTVPSVLSGWNAEFSGEQNSSEGLAVFFRQKVKALSMVKAWFG